LTYLDKEMIVSFNSAIKHFFKIFNIVNQRKLHKAVSNDFNILLNLPLASEIENNSDCLDYHIPVTHLTGLLNHFYVGGWS